VVAVFLDRERIDCLGVSYLARGRKDPNVLHIVLPIDTEQ
jgi:hypothetical protein